MRNRNSIRSLILTVIITGGFLVIWAATPVTEKRPCKEESLEKCCKKSSEGNTDNMSWGTLPHRFFSSLSLD